MKLSNYERNFLHRRVVLNLFIYLLINYHVHYQHNQLHEIGKDLKWRTTYLESASLPVKHLYEARGRRSRAYSWASLPCLLVGVAPVPLSRKPQLHINHNFHIHSFLNSYSSGNLVYLGLGINLIGSSQLKL